MAEHLLASFPPRYLKNFLLFKFPSRGSQKGKSDATGLGTYEGTGYPDSHRVQPGRTIIIKGCTTPGPKPGLTIGQTIIYPAPDAACWARTIELMVT
ncbi:hypothetical protein PoB_000308500 [Plakobranchus ocellatus]|uniref:Uncharacterized protein n=1 Tax=Plakobranchus ocellatus TaxID=259542 RepID=A0AAV3Y0H5_9GAST|nr:hypothetical protein PoB_000308500 [Plakobranchus ocellatus]